MKAAMVCAGVGVVALLVAWLLAGSPASSLLLSYLGTWLFFLGLPLGALALLMMMELAGAAAHPMAWPLRRVLAVLPLAALLAIPVLVGLHGLYPWSHHAIPGQPGAWFRPGGFVLRSIVYLAIWVVLGLVFMWPASPGGAPWRRPLAVVGLLLHLVIGTLAATDWAMSLEPALNSSLFGLLLVVAQCGAALAAAVLLAAAGGQAGIAAAGLGPLVALLGAWLFLQFTQYLIIWSADLPREIVWYQQRMSGFGGVTAWGALVVCLLAFLAVLPRGLPRGTVSGVVAALVLLLHLAEALWLTTPAIRGRFVVTWTDLLLILGIGGVVAGATLAWQGRGQTARPGVPVPSGGHLAGT